MLLSIMNNLNRADRQVRNGKWEREGNRGQEIRDKTVGIIGYGNMGSAFAQRLSGFDANVLSYDKYKKDYSDGNTHETTLEEIFDLADIVSIHVPLTEETRYMCNDEFFKLFRKKIWFLNTSRGLVVNTIELVNHLKSGKLLGVALDVLEYEDASFENISGNYPGAFRYLTECDNVILTPHIAGWTVESNIKLAKVLVDKILNRFTAV
jgi:D-3-phosphoglycerate dehydrogenase